MNRLIPAVIILSLIIIITFFGGRLVRKTEAELIEKVDSIMEEPTHEKAEDLKKYWDKKSAILSIFINREGIEAVGEHTSKLYAAYHSGDQEEIQSSGEEIKYIMSRITENERFNYHSLF
jgi:peptidoglycan hydrolase CwlO-like protein